MNRRMRRFVCILCFAAGFVGLMASASANTARRASLSNSELIEDSVDTFFYPQLVTEYSNRVGFDYGAEENSGNAYIFLGDEQLAGGVAIHRGDMFASSLYPYNGLNARRLGGAQPPLNSPLQNPMTGDDAVDGSFIPSSTIFDLFGGMAVGPNSSLGARLSIGLGSESLDLPNDDDASEGQFFLTADVGFSTELQGVELDSSLELFIDTGDNNQLADNGPSDDHGDDIWTGSVWNLTFENRAFFAMQPNVELGALFDIGYTGTSMTYEPGENQTSSAGMFSAQIGAGPVYYIDPLFESDEEDYESPYAQPEHDGSTVAGYAVLGYNSSSLDPNVDSEDDAVSTGGFIVPGFHVAADLQLLDWLYFRSGAQYWYQTRSVTAEGGDGDEVSGSTAGNFTWSTGLGLEFGRFRFDGSLSNSFLTNGPNFISGASDSLFGIASAEYAW